MNLYHKFIYTFCSCLLLFAVGCVNDSTKAGTATGGSPNQVNRVTANSFTAPDINANTLTIVELSYTDLDHGLATSCSVNNLNHASIINACECTGAGICSVGIRTPSGYTGAGSFKFSVVSSGKTSTSGTASFTVIPRGASIPPVSNNIAPASFNEDVQSIIILSYYDVDSDLATSCSISSLTHITETRACACDAGGVCSVGVTGASNYNGSASFGFTVTSNDEVSNISNSTLTIDAVNDAPSLSTIASQATLENTATTFIGFTIADLDSTVTCANVSGSSSDTILVPNANIIISGTAPNCLVKVTPGTNKFGNANITLTVTDNGTPSPAKTATSLFALTVTAVNSAPTISNVGNQVTNEDTMMPAKSFTIADVDSVVSCSNVTATSSNTALVPSASIVISGTAPNCNVTASPSANQNGTATITLMVTDNGTPLPALTATSTFILTVNPVNDAPTISVITDQGTNEGVATNAISFSILDVDSTLACSNVSVSSSNLVLVPNANIVISGTAANCTVVVTPAANQNGGAAITLMVTDNGTPTPALTATSVFNLTVGPMNSPPTISFIANSTTNEDTSVNVDFMVDDIDSTPVMTCSASHLAIFSSSNGTLIPGITGSDVIFSGSYPNCRATFTPGSNQNGTSNIVIRVTDNGYPTPVKTTDSNVFIMTVNPVNDAPVISTVAAQAVNKNSPTSALSFTISDIDSFVNCSNVVATSSDNVLVPNANIVIVGTASNCTATVTPANNQIGAATITLTLTDTGTPMPALTASSNFVLTVNAFNIPPTISTVTAKTTNEDVASAAIAFTIADTDSSVACSNVLGTSSNTAIVPNANIVIGGTAPDCTATITSALNQNGLVNITLTLTDLGTPTPVKTAATTFTLTITPINDAPVISSILAQTTNEDTPSSAIAFTITDVDNTLVCTSAVSGVSSNLSVLANAGIVIGGTASNCTVTLTPVANASGTSDVTLTVTDGTLSATNTFTLTVTAVNDAPVISAIAAQTTNEDTVKSGIAFTITDVDSALTCATSVTGVSSNTALVANAGIVVSGTAPSCFVALTPLANANGVTTITLTVNDGSLTQTSAFTLTVAAVNDAPTISAISAKSTDEDVASSAIAFSIADIDSSSAMTCANVTGTSSNITIVPHANIVIGGTAPNCTATITSAANQSGSVNITLTVTDNGTPLPALTATSVFALTIVPVPDLSGTLAMSGVASSYSSNTYARSMVFTALTIDENASFVDICLSRDANANGILDVAELCNVQNWLDITTAIGAAGKANGSTWTAFKLKNGANSAIFTAGESPLQNSCSAINTYWLSVKVFNTNNRESNVITSSAWTFWEPTCLGTGVLSQWLDSSEPSTFTLATTKVSAWADKSGNARSVSQATSANQPSYSATGLGTGLSGVTFNGTSTTLTRAAFAYAQGSASFFTVIKATASTLKYVFSEGRSVTTSGYYAPLSTSTTNTITGKIVSDALTTLLNLPTSSAVFFDNTIRLGMAEDSGINYYTYSNGTPQTQVTTPYTRATTTVDTYCLGGLTIKGVISSRFTGTIGEFIITNGVLSASDRNKLEGYSAHKWASTTGLPALHTYKTTPP